LDVSKNTYYLFQNRLIRLRLVVAIRVVVFAIAFAAMGADVGTISVLAQEKVSSGKSKTQKPALRTLEDINIEGEIAVPQVLFITSRDYRRYRDGLGLTFRLKSIEVARSLDLPTRLRVVAKDKEEGK